MSKKEADPKFDPFAQHKKEMQRKKKIKNVFAGIIIGFSFLCSSAYVIEEYLIEADAIQLIVVYLFLWAWAINHATSSNN